jgi:hypothetical protein
MKLTPKKLLWKSSFLASVIAWTVVLGGVFLPSMALAEIECHGLYPDSSPAADDCGIVESYTGSKCCMDGHTIYECVLGKLYCEACPAGKVCKAKYLSELTCGSPELGPPWDEYHTCQECPECAVGESCVVGKCCVKDCDGAECGLDGCGGVCGECEYGFCQSMALKGQCPKPGLCEASGEVSCGDELQVSTGPGESGIEVYSCAPGVWGQTCAETVLSFSPDETVIVTLSADDFLPQYADIDIFVLEGSCDSMACLGAGLTEGQYWGKPEEVQFIAESGKDYYVVLEVYPGWPDECGMVTASLKVECLEDCAPDCQEKTCGPDGCLGSCGDCAVGQCVDGVCQAGPGCEVTTGEPGCDACSCEDCVCDIDPMCCWSEWGSFCAAVCIGQCGGCTPLTACTDGICQLAMDENCHTCPQDCECEDGLVCADGQCCLPNCAGKECGYDGCGGLCGDCGPDEACSSGQCVTQDGCQDGMQPGCSGCMCEACVCSLFDGYCCAIAWDFACAIVCEQMCEGCGFVEACGDDVCDAEAGEGCDNCQADCGCEAPETCHGNKCCQPDCEDKECGPTGCGGICGYCDKWSDDLEACTTAGHCVPVGDWTCSVILECLAACDEWDVECADYCGDMGTSGEQDKLDSMLTCLMEAGMWECGNDEECLLLGWAQCEEEVLACTAGTAPCGDLYECTTNCPVLDGDCVGMCAWGGAEPAFHAFLELMECLAPMCPMGLSNCDLAASFAECSQQADACLGPCEWECLGKECGEDGCGGVCGLGPLENLGCPEAEPVCDLSTYSCQPCPPDCEQKSCGDDGCGGSCGECGAGYLCVDGFCEPAGMGDVVEQTDLQEDSDLSSPEILIPDQQGGDQQTTDRSPSDKSGEPETSDDSDAAKSDSSTDLMSLPGGAGEGGCGGCVTASNKNSGALPTGWVLLMLGLWLFARRRVRPLT